jgi:ABC-type branched-subunit amino acid transport system ATPase component
MLACLYLSATDVWLLDEPASGLAKAEVDRLGPLLRSLVRESAGRSVVLVEHDASLVRTAADRVILLERGRVMADAAKGTEAWTDILEGRASVARRFAERKSMPEAALAIESAPELVARDLRVSYGKFEAVRGVTVEVKLGEVRCLVGTNGAGKSTIMRSVAGLLTPASGTITVDGAPVPRSAHARVIESGIVLVAGGKTVFPDLTVKENLQLTQSPDGELDVLEVFPALAAKQGQLAGSLSGGEQQMLGVARGLQLRPRFLLIDELSLGLAEEVVDRLLSNLITLVQTGRMGILLVEQDYAQALTWSSHAYVLAQGQLQFSGPSAEAEKRPDLFRPVFMPSA